ncbi:MAG: AAA family ATPase [Anaerolineales bacterium]|nr:AAA family ATPase [Anaerolineales bacterium]
MDDSSLLQTKFYRPRRRATHVVRTRLRHLLNRSAERGWVLVVAGAGFGKTTVIADWTEACAQRTCWLSLDRIDSNPARYFAYLIAAIEQRQPQVVDGLSALLNAAQRQNHYDTFVNALLNRMAQLDERLIIVLDDYHRIEDEQIHRAMNHLLTHSPPLATFVLLTRSDPSLPLARMRVSGKLTELRADALAFTVDEASRFFNESFGLSLSDEQVQALSHRTEGWSAGLQMAALALQTSDQDPAHFIKNFTGSHGHVIDYLVEEVLRGQPAEVQDFMMQLSPLRQFNVALCNAVLDESGARNAAVMLDYLETHNLFLIPLDDSRQWYRYHHLFADLLQAELEKVHPAATVAIHLRAADWYESEGDHAEAIDYALTGGDYERAAALIQGQLTSTMWQTALSTWQRWQHLLPPSFAADYPVLAITMGQALAVSGRVHEMIPLWRRIERDGLPLFGRLIHAYLNADDAHDADYFATLAQEAQSQSLDQAELIMLSFVLGSTGDYRAAGRTVDQAAAESQRVGDDFSSWMALIHRCRFYIQLGALRHAYELCQTVLSLVPSLSPAARDLLGLAYTSLGRIYLAWNELERAEAYLQQALRHVNETGFRMAVLPHATMLLAETKQAQGRTDEAQRLAARAVDHARRFDFASEALWLQAYEAQLFLRQGNVAAAAARLLEQSKLPPSRFYPQSIYTLATAQLYLAQNRASRAVALLTGLVAELPDIHTVEAWVTLALARQMQGDGQHAGVALTTAIGLAESENQRRPFLNQADLHGKLLVRLLSRMAGEQPDNRFVQTLLALLPATEEDAAAQSNLTEPLSERELAVLRLIAAGHSNKEIAAELMLAVSTIKWYINVLYSKLHVRSRSQAIARAHELKLLTPPTGGDAR